jgi:hypothetical protein
MTMRLSWFSSSRSYVALATGLALAALAGCGNGGGGMLPPGLFPDATPPGPDLPPVVDTAPAVDTAPTPDMPPAITQGLELGNGTPGSATMTQIVAASDGLDMPRDLAFNTRMGHEDELWIVNMTDNGMVIVQKTTDDAARTAEHRVDGYALHFMAKPSSIAFGQDQTSDRVELTGDTSPRLGTFATCQESRNTYNDTAAPNDFMGPVLWSSDLDIFAMQNPNGLGSHLDMLHNSPLCVGIAWEGSGNKYWTISGNRGMVADPGFDVIDNAIIRYDFQKDDGIGNDNHLDGESYVYVAGQTAYVAGVPSHLVFDASIRTLYIADTGNGRIAKLDTTAGSPGQQLVDAENRRTYYMISGANPLVDVVPASAGLVHPSGLKLKNGILYVSDNQTSQISAFDLTGQKVNSFDTGLPEGSLAGINFGPDGKLYFVDMVGNRVFRLDTTTAAP